MRLKAVKTIDWKGFALFAFNWPYYGIGKPAWTGQTLIFYCLTPDDFTCQWATPRSQWVKIVKHLLKYYFTHTVMYMYSSLSLLLQKARHTVLNDHLPYSYNFQNRVNRTHPTICKCSVTKFWYSFTEDNPFAPEGIENGTHVHIQCMV